MRRGGRIRQLRTGLRREDPNRPRLAPAVVMMLLFFGTVCIASAQANSPNEYAVKAAFLFHFAQFVEWPEGACQDANSPLVYCTIGEDPFQGALDESLKGKTIEARALQVRHLKDGRDAQGCHVVFIGKTDKRRVTDELTSLGNSPVLTVGDRKSTRLNSSHPSISYA